MRPRDPLLNDEPSRATRWIAVGLAALVCAYVIVRLVGGDRNPSPVAGASASATATASASASASPPAGPRCVEASGVEGFVIGEPPKAAPPTDAGDEAADDAFSPFAVEVAKGTVFDGGFAAGALRDGEGGTLAMVATVGVDGRGGKLVRLARARGDLDPPVVAGAGPSILAAMLEPHAGGRAIKIAKVTGTDVAWGPEFSEGKDESNALDLAASGDRAVVVWDDLDKNGDRSNVLLASFDIATMQSVTPPQPVSGKKSDADTPRLVVRPGGFWLGYLVRADPDSGKKKKAKKDEDDVGPEDEDTDVTAGEAIAHRWVEVVPLDEAGKPMNSPRAVTSKEGNVLAFELGATADGVLVIYRDDDTPTGSGGGRLNGVLARLGGSVEPRPLVPKAAAAPSDDDVTEKPSIDEMAGSGAPTLLPNWLVMSGLSGRTYLASMGSTGELLEPLSPEPVLGSAEVLATVKDTLLIARTDGKAMRLVPIRCTPRPKSP